MLTALEAPEELLHGRVQGALVERIDDLLALTLINDQVCVSENRQMTRDRRLREIKLRDDLADIARLQTCSFLIDDSKLHIKKRLSGAADFPKLIFRSHTAWTTDAVFIGSS